MLGGCFIETPYILLAVPLLQIRCSENSWRAIYSTVHVDLFLEEKTYLTRPNYPIVTIVSFTRSTLPVPAEEIKPKAWALSDEKATRFNEKKNNDNYLEEKFFSGQGTATKSKQLL